MKLLLSLMETKELLLCETANKMFFGSEKMILTIIISCPSSSALWLPIQIYIFFLLFHFSFQGWKFVKRGWKSENFSGL